MSNPATPSTLSRDYHNTSTTPTNPGSRSESLLDYLGTLGRRKQMKEVEDLQQVCRNFCSLFLLLTVYDFY